MGDLEGHRLCLLLPEESNHLVLAKPFLDL